MLNVGGEEVKGGDSYSTLKPSLVFSFACAKIDFLTQAMERDGVVL